MHVQYSNPLMYITYVPGFFSWFTDKTELVTRWFKLIIIIAPPRYDE
jgi:hypothetical protein